MKKFLILMGCACVIFTSAVSAEIGGSTFDVKAGWVRSSVGNSDTVDFNMWKFSGAYKYQAPDAIYGSVNGSYAVGGSKKAKDLKFNKVIFANTGKVKPTAWDFNGAIGWTFGLGDSGMISPFIGFGYKNFKLKASSTDKGNNSSFEAKWYGFYTKAGVDFLYMVSENFSTGLVASVGLPLSNKLKVSKKDKDGKEELKGDSKLKNSPFFEVAVPFNYHMDDWKLGLELSYAHFCYEPKNKSEDGKFKRNDFGVALTAGMVF